jgi:hypothetical protein
MGFWSLTMYPDQRQRSVFAYALTLFILGAMVGLLAVLGRAGQEVLTSLFPDVREGFLQPVSITPKTPLPAMVHSLDRASDRLIVLGFMVSAACMAAGGYFWFSGGIPSTQRPPAWTLTGVLIALLQAVGMAFALLCGDANLRLAVLIVTLISALALFVTFVLLVVREALQGGSIPDSGKKAFTTEDTESIEKDKG